MNERNGHRILLSIIAAVVLAFFAVALFGERMLAVEWIGTFFLKALKMIIVPLVMASMVVGITGLGDVRRLGRVGALTVLYYALTTGIAVALGIVLVNLVQPGTGTPLRDLALPEQIEAKKALSFQDILLSFVSDNIVRAMAEMDLLPVIVFALLLGGVLTTLDERGRPVIAFFTGLNEAMMKMVRLLMLLAPLGVFGLVAGRFARAGDLQQVLGTLGKYTGTVLLGLAIHGLIVLPLILWLLRRRNPYRYMLHMGTALLTAFSTASSSATLPVTMECVEEKNKVSRRAAYFVLPVGATVNMDGTALYESVAALFIAQALGRDLGFGQQVMVFLTATLAAIGAAGIPEAGLVTMVIVLRAVDLPLEGIGMILAVDWLLDRFRTTVNVWGDAAGAAIIERHMPVGAIAPVPSFAAALTHQTTQPSVR